MARYEDAEQVPGMETKSDKPVKEEATPIRVPVVVSQTEMLNLINEKLDILLAQIKEPTK